jgi:hypothetical protein
MKIVWKVSHIFRVPMEYESGPTTYPALGATLVLKDAKISQVDHELAAEDSVPRGEIVEISTQQLSILWDAIIYVSGYPALQANRTVKPLGNAAGSSPLSTNLQTLVGQSSVVRRLRLPDETRLLSLTGRLHVWLRLANDARPPASPIDAIRNYYMIWEDMHGRPATAGSPEQELKFIRDFVSHGEILTRRPLLTFLQRQVGPGTRQYDPSNPIHQRFVEKRREWARKLVESEINRHL